jgi:hypothetical protein
MYIFIYMYKFITLTLIRRASIRELLNGSVIIGSNSDDRVPTLIMDSTIYTHCMKKKRRPLKKTAKRSHGLPYIGQGLNKGWP